jgi:uncharacterized protein (TIGR02677 family)
MPNESFVAVELPAVALEGQRGNGHAPGAPARDPAVAEAAGRVDAVRGGAPEAAPTAEAPGAAGAPGARAFHERLLEPGERDRLRALLVGTTERAERYLAILSAMVAARAAYRPQLRTEELLALLPAGALELDFDGLVIAMDALKGMGCVDWAPDTRHVTRKEDMYRRRAQWYLTAVGVAAFDAAQAVLAAVETAGGLRARLFEGLRRNLELLLVAVRAGDAGGVYGLLRSLDTDLRDLTRSAQDFSTRLAELTRGSELDAAVFLDCKELLLAYLSTFSDDLYRYRRRMAATAAEVAAEGVDRLVELAAAGDDGAAAALGLGSDLRASWRSRWTGLERWLAASDGRPSGLDELFSATTLAVRDVLSQIRRLSEAESRPVNRTSELLALARWFHRCDGAPEAHALFDAAFGLGRTPRVSGLPPDPTATGPRASWWAAEPVEIAVSLRERGQQSTPGKTARAVDFSAQREALAAEAAAAERERAEAAAALASAPLAGRVLSRAELELLLTLVDECLLGLPDKDGEAVFAAAEGVTVLARPDPAGCTVRSVDGALVFDGLVVEVADQ